MAAITNTILALAHAGDHVVAATTLYGGTFNLLKETLPRYGITATFVDVDDLVAIEEAINNAALEAGTYIASYTTVKNFVITEDEIKSITSSIIKVLNQQVTFETPSADKWVCHAHILAEVDTSTLENLVDAYIEKQRNANNHVYTEPNNNTHNNINIGEQYS